MINCRSIPFRYLCNYTGHSWKSNVRLNRTDNDTLADRWGPCGAETELKAEVARGNEKRILDYFFPELSCDLLISRSSNAPGLELEQTLSIQVYSPELHQILTRVKSTETEAQRRR